MPCNVNKTFFLFKTEQDIDKKNIKFNIEFYPFCHTELSAFFWAYSVIILDICVAH